MFPVICLKTLLVLEYFYKLFVLIRFRFYSKNIVAKFFDCCSYFVTPLPRMFCEVNRKPNIDGNMGIDKVKHINMQTIWEHVTFN